MEKVRKRRIRGFIRPSFVAFAASAVAVWWVLGGTLHLYGLIAVGLMAVKLLLSLTYRPYRVGDRDTSLDRWKIVTVVPTYNEDPDTFERCLHSILTQERRVQEVHVVDDASHDRSAADRARSMKPLFEQAGIALHVHIQPENKGKREALARGFLAAPDADGYLCVDSDTVLDPEAVGELLKAFHSPKVKAATGLVLALNQRKNFLTRLIDLRYGNAFLFERAAYSRLGSVLCCCGSLVIYRGDVVHKNLHDFVTQKFFGRPAIFGDDRRLTNYSLIEGKVLFQETAVAYTAVPERLPHFLRQQVRWNKSFFRESQWALRKLSKVRPGFYLTLIEVSTWFVFTGAMLTSVVYLPLTQPGSAAGHLTTYLIFTVLMGYVRSVRYLDFRRPGTTLIGRLAIYSLAPVYGVLHLFLLLPIRLYAMLTMARGQWGTRQNGVEVADDEVATAGLYQDLAQETPLPRPADPVEPVHERAPEPVQEWYAPQARAHDHHEYAPQDTYAPHYAPYGQYAEQHVEPYAVPEPQPVGYDPYDPYGYGYWPQQQTESGAWR